MLAGNVFTLLVGLPLQIFISRTLGASGLGVFGLLEAGVGILAPFLGFGLPQTAIRFLPVHLERQEYKSARRLVRLSVYILLATSGAVCVFVLLGLPWLAEIWPEVREHRLAAAMMALMIPLGSVLFFIQQALRGFQDIRYMVLGSSVVQLTVKAVITIAVFAIGYRVEGYVFATVASTLVCTLWMATGLKRKFAALPEGTPRDPSIDLTEWRRYATLNYATGLLSTALGGSGLERFLLGFFFGPAAVGVLVVVRQLQNLPAVFNQMLLVVGAPMIASAHARDDAKERQHIYALMTDWVVRSSIPLMLFLLIFAREILALFGPEFAAEGVATLRILVATLMFNIASGPTGNVALMCGLENPFLRFTAFTLTLRAVLLVVLTPYFGLMGIALAFGASYIWWAIYNVALIHDKLGMQWWDERFLRWTYPTIATIAVAVLFLVSGLPIGMVVLGATLILMYAVFLGVCLMQGLHEDDRELFSHVKDRMFRSAA